MKEKYKVNNIFDEAGMTFNELVSTFLLSFLDRELDTYEINGIINTNIVSNL